MPYSLTPGFFRFYVCEVIWGESVMCLKDLGLVAGPGIVT